ncbi:MAG: PatB family C-S lyase [Clostridia bacterium]|nr:PatB family C-S lyase [Clostridia bacterium]
MTFDFDSIVERRGTGSIKWDVKDGELPMWVADMDFQTAPAIREAVAKIAEHGIYGYTDTDDAWRAAYAGWWRDRHNWEIDPAWLVYATGVIPAISSAVRKLTTPAEKVALLTPVYNIFFNSILNNGRVPVEVPLAKLRTPDDKIAYRIDFDLLEEALADPQTSLFLFCNPHNPVGKIWDRETLAMVGALCAKHGVTVISDEIHCDIARPGKSYVPFASVNEVNTRITVTCLAPTKAFNCAGIQTAAVVCADPILRHKMWRGLNTDEVGEPNVFAVPVAVAAFREGGEWLDAMNRTVFSNRETVERFAAEQIPEIEVVPADATYLIWISLEKILGEEDSAAFCRFLREKTGLWLSAGTQYRGDGDRFVRLNAACPPALLQDGMERLRTGVRLWIEKKS